MRFKHNFPADGEYRITVLFPDQTVGLYTGSLENESTLVIMVDGKIMFKKPIGGMDDLTLNNRKAGDGRAQITERFRKVPLQLRPVFTMWWSDTSSVRALNRRMRLAAAVEGVAAGIIPVLEISKLQGRTNRPAAFRRPAVR
jgi:hypothetical protein